MVEGPLTLQLAQGVVAQLRGVRVVQHMAPLLLIGCDVLRGGRATGWNYAGTVCPVVQGKVEARISF